MKTFPLIQRLWREFISPYLLFLGGGIACMTISALTTAVLAQFLQPVFDDVFGGHNPEKLIFLAGLILGVFVLKGLATYGESLFMTFVGQKIVLDFQSRLFNRLIHADLAFFHRQTSGILTSTFTHDVTLLRGSLTQSLTSMGKDTLTLFFLVSLMFYQDFILACATFFIFPLAILPLIRIGRRMRKVSYGTQEAVGKFQSFLQQVFLGIRLVKAYGMESYEQQRASQQIQTLFHLNLKGAKVRSAAHPIMETLGGLAIVCVILYGGHQVIQGTRSTGTFMSFITALLLAYEPVKRLIQLNATLQEGLAAATRLFTLLDQPNFIKDKQDAKPLFVEKGTITFSHLSFTYPTGKPVFHDLSFTVPGQQCTAFVGPSGSGKSTLLNLLLRFYDVNQGAIHIDGQNLQDISLASLRQHIAFVSQEITLFDDTIYENIRYGRPQASQEEIEQAAKAAGAHDFILTLPQGYQTFVGEQGIKISGGQRQRLAIARAVLKDAPILLLDEATASLDTASEHQIQNALYRLMEGRTTIMIAHRLTTVKAAHNIYVFEHGCLVEKGNHQSLLDKHGLYARLVVPTLLQE